MKTWRSIGFVVAMGIFVPANGAIAQDTWGEDAGLPVEIHGFVEAAAGGRIVDDKTQPDDILLGEARFQLDLAHYTDRAEATFRGDFTADDVSNETDIDIRQTALLLRVARWLDVRGGRQVLTWGTGDLLFLNDLFPKDWVSFFIGRDDEYLKAPSNSIKATFFAPVFDADLVWTPVFEPDRYITGERLSFFDPGLPGRTSAAQMGGPLEAARPERTWDNSELAVRLYRTISGYELAAYGYVGFTKRPLAFDATANEPTFGEQAVYGASARGNLFGAIANIEGAWYDSYNDRDGTDPYLPNSELRGLVGYEREMLRNFTTAFQYYFEWIQNYDELIAGSPYPEREPEEVRHVVTTRLSHRLRQQTLLLSLFVYFSPNEEDGSARPSVVYKWSDATAITLGGNVMWGPEDTFFGQLKDNNNVYLRLRYSF